MNDIFNDPEYWCGEKGYRPDPNNGKGYQDWGINQVKAKYIADRNPETVLDVGCAMGYIVRRMRNLGVNAFGVDVSDYCIERVPPEMAEYVRKLDITEGLPWPDKFLDMVVSFSTLEHIEPDKIDFVISEIVRVAKRGVISVTAGDDPGFDDDATHKVKQSMDWWRSKFPPEFEVIPDHDKFWTAIPDAQQTVENGYKLKIALVAPPFIPVPPVGYGGSEVVIHDLAVALADRGHTVTVFAADESSRDYNYDVVGFGPAINQVDCNWMEAEKNAYLKIRSQLVEFDIIHDHTWFGFAYELRKSMNKKVCHTHHGHMDNRWWTAPPFPLNLFGISDFMCKEFSQYTSARRVYNGINMNKYTFSNEPTKTRLLFVGRASKFKQPHAAIEVAKRSGMGLDLVCGKFVDDPEYLEQIKQACDGVHIRYIEEPPQEEKVKLMQEAYALISPSAMGEPFGLMNAEAMACGTPCICTNDGAMAEVVKHGETGFICNNIDDMVESAKLIDTINRKDCHYRVLENFSREVMAANYEKCYKDIIEGKEW